MVGRVVRKPQIQANTASDVASAVGAMVATQADMEAGTSLTTLVTPGRLGSHGSVLKFWVSADSDTLLQSYNVASVTDSGNGKLTVTIDTDFSSADWCAFVCVASDAFVPMSYVYSQAAGTTQVRCFSYDDVALEYPVAWFVGGVGDQ